MAYEYCRECACELIVLDDLCPECGARTHNRFIGTAGRILGPGQLMGIGITLFGFSLSITQLLDHRSRYWEFLNPSWFVFAGMFIYLLAPYRR